MKEPEATVVLRSPFADTDILVIPVSLISSSQDRVFINYGNGKNRKAIKLSNVNMATGPKQALGVSMRSPETVTFHRFSQNQKQQAGRKW